jgi:hypothetical protein
MLPRALLNLTEVVSSVYPGKHRNGTLKFLEMGFE